MTKAPTGETHVGHWGPIVGLGRMAVATTGDALYEISSALEQCFWFLRRNALGECAEYEAAEDSRAHSLIALVGENEIQSFFDEDTVACADGGNVGDMTMAWYLSESRARPEVIDQACIKSCGGLIERLRIELGDGDQDWHRCGFDIFQ